MPATVTDSTKPNPLRPATSSSERPLAAHSSSTDRLAPVTAAAEGPGAPTTAASPLFASLLRVLASTCGGTNAGGTGASGSGGNAVPLARFVAPGDAGDTGGVGGPGGRPPNVVVASARRSVAVRRGAAV